MWFCRFFVFATLSEAVELLHGFGLELVAHIYDNKLAAFPLLLTKHSQVGNKAFPIWE